jgi:hypothetical protein
MIVPGRLYPHFQRLKRLSFVVLLNVAQKTPRFQSEINQRLKISLRFLGYTVTNNSNKYMGGH